MDFMTMKLNQTTGFTASVLLAPLGGFDRGHTAPIFRRLLS
jgi:hypothetical protein